MQNYSQIFKTMSLLLSALVIASCQYKTYGPEANKDPIATQVQDSAPLNQSATADSSIPAHAPPDSYEALMAKHLSVSELVTQVVEPLALYVLDPNILKDGKTTSSDAFFQTLRAYHHALRLLAETSTARATEQTILKKYYGAYEQTVLKPCRQDVNNCEVFKIITRDSNSTSVILNATRILSLTSAQSWDYSFFAYESNPSALTEAAQTQFLANAVAYIRSIPDDGSRTSLSQAADAGRRLNQLMATQMGIGALQNDSRRREFLEKIDIWAHLGANHNVEQVRNALWPVLLQMGPSDAKGTMSPSYMRWTNQELANFGVNVVAKFRNQAAMRRVWSAFSLNDPRTGDRNIAFVLDQAFTGKLDKSNAIAMIEFTHPDLKHLIDLTQDYMRVRFVNEMVLTHQNLQEYLGDADHFKTVKEFEESLTRINPVEIAWATFLTRTRSVHAVIDGLISGRAVTPSAEMTQSLETTFSKITTDIRQMVTYPNMLAILYRAAQANLTGTSVLAGYPVPLIPDTVFAMLFNGELHNFFNFTDSSKDDHSLLTPEAIVAFRTALASELFASYKISPGSFLLETANRMLTATNNSLDEASTSLYFSLYVGQDNSQNSETSSGVFMNTMAFCKGTKKDEILPFATLPKSIVGPELPAVAAQSSAAIYNLGVYNSDGNSRIDHSVFIESLRNDHNYRLDLVQKMRDIYALYLQQNHLSDPQLAEVDQKLIETRQRQRRYLGMMYFAVKQYDDCLLQIADISEHRQAVAFNYEQFYLSQAYRDLVYVTQNPAQLQAINAKYAKMYSEIGTASRDHFSVTNGQYYFTYSKVDFLMRLKDYLQKGAVDLATGRYWPAIAPRMTIAIPSQLKYDPALAFIADHSQELQIGLQPGQQESDFMAQAYVQFANVNELNELAPVSALQPFVNWWGSKSYGRIFPKGRTTTIGTLMKLGPVEVYDFSSPGCDPTKENESLEKKCIRIQQIGPEDVYQYQINVLKRVSLSPETIAVFNKTHTSARYGGEHTFWNLYFSKLTRLPLGLLDPYLLIASVPALGYNLGSSWPGAIELGATVPPAVGGMLERAMKYHDAFGPTSKESNLVSIRPELEGDIKGLYQGYVTKEFALQIALEKFADEKSKGPEGTLQLNLYYDRPAFVIPMRTNFATLSSVRETTFNSATDFIFTTPK